jgi:hypothetical protein
MAMTRELLRALDGSGVPARVTDPVTGRVSVLLKAADFDRIRQMLGDEPDAPRLTDPRTRGAFALVPVERYERFRAFFEDDPLTAAEREALLRDFGRRAGWDDPALDAYDGPGQP